MTFNQLTQYLNGYAVIFLGRELNSVEVKVLKGSLMGLSYKEISKVIKYEADGLKQIGSFLWTFCSYVLNQKVQKNNLREVVTQPEVSNKVLEYCTTKLGSVIYK